MANLLIKKKSLVGLRLKSLFDFNIVGLDDQLKRDEAFLKEAEKIRAHFHGFNEKVNRKIDLLNGDIDEERTKQKKFAIANPVLDEIKSLASLGKENKIYKTDYKILREQLLRTLIRLFRSYEDREVLAHSVHVLEDNRIIPNESQKEIMKMTPMGRWL